MDTNHKAVRVLITDISVRRGTTILSRNFVLNGLSIVDSKGHRWAPGFTGWVDSVNVAIKYGDHLSTPLALPVDSSLTVEFETRVHGNPGTNDVFIHLIGRLVTL